MNPVIAEGVSTVSGTWIMGVMTGLFLAVFVGFGLWAWAPGNKAAMEAAGRIPLDEEG